MSLAKGMKLSKLGSQQTYGQEHLAWFVASREEEHQFVSACQAEAVALDTQSFLSSINVNDPKRVK